MKRFISIFLTLLMLLQMPAVIAEEQTTDNNIEKLQYFGMIMPEMSIAQGKKPTRAEFAKYLIYYLGKSETVPKATESYFYDVPMSNSYVSYINYLLDLGYIKKDASGTFSPEEEITLKDAALMLLSAMGYGAFSDSASADVSNAYSAITKGAAQIDGKATIGGIITMFGNALEVPMYELSEMNAGNNVVFTKENTFLEGYFHIYEIKGRINGTRLTGLEESMQLAENEAAIDSRVFRVAENLPNITDYLGYYVKAYYKENDDHEDEIIYLEDNKTSELVIKSTELVGYSDNKIRYEVSDSGRIKTASFENGAYIIYNGQLMTKYTSDIFDISNGSIELVGKGNAYDVVKIYDYTDFVIGGVSIEENKIYSQYTSDVYTLDEYENVIIRDRYGRELSLEELKFNMVASVGISGGNTIIFNISDKQISGKLNSADYGGSTAKWNIDGIEYEFSAGLTYPNKPVNTTVTVYLNYLNKIAYILAGKNEGLLYGYLIKANIDDSSETVIVKIFTEDGNVEDYTTREKVVVDGERCGGEDIIQKLKYEQPNSLNPSDTVQPQLIRYNVNSEGKITKIDTAKLGDNEDEDTTLSKDIINESRIYMSENRRLFGNGDRGNYKMDCLVADDTKVFIVPGNLKDAQTEYGAYSVATSSYFIREKTYNIDAYNVDYNDGAKAGVVIVRLDSLVDAPEVNPFESMMIVTGVGKTIDNDDNVVKTIEGYSYSSNGIVKVSDYEKARIFENSNIEPGDIIRYGYVNNNITGCDIDIKKSTQLVPGYVCSPRITANNCGYHVFAYYRLMVSNIVDINSGYLYLSDNPTDMSTAKNCDKMFDLSGTRIFVYDENSKKHLEQIDVATLKNYTYKNDKNAKAVVYSSYGNALMVVVYK